MFFSSKALLFVVYSKQIRRKSEKSNAFTFASPPDYLAFTSTIPLSGCIILPVKKPRENWKAIRKNSRST